MADVLLPTAPKRSPVLSVMSPFPSNLFSKSNNKNKSDQKVPVQKKTDQVEREFVREEIEVRMWKVG